MKRTCPYCGLRDTYKSEQIARKGHVEEIWNCNRCNTSWSVYIKRENTRKILRIGWWRLETTIDTDEENLQEIASMIQQGYTEGQIQHIKEKN